MTATGSDTLMVSVSGVRGIVGKDLSPVFVARYAAAFGALARQAEHQRQADAYIAEVREALDDCREKYGRGNCQLIETPSTEFGFSRNF